MNGITDMTALSVQNRELKEAVRRLAAELAAEEAGVWGLRRAEIALWRDYRSTGGERRTDEILEQSEAVLQSRLPLMLAEMEKLDSADEERETIRAAAHAAAASVERSQQSFVTAEEEIARRSVSGPEIAALDEQERKLRTILKKNAGWRDELAPIVEERLAAYDSDPLFAYLLSRGFGTEKYTARWPLTRLDAVLARWAGYRAAKENRDKVAGYAEGYASDVARAERALAAIEPKRRAAVARIKSELEPVREALARALISTSSVVDRFAACTARKAAAVEKLRDFAAGRDKAYEMITEAVVMVTSRERAAAALRADRPDSVGPGSEIAGRVDALLRQRMEAARRADGVRRNFTGLLDRLEAVQKALDKAAAGDVDPQEMEFLLASNEVELA